MHRSWFRTRLTGGLALAAGSAAGQSGELAVAEGDASARQSDGLSGPARHQIGKVAALLRRNWLITGLLLAGLALRAAAQIGYRPALFFIDTTRYLFHAGGNDPVGYRVPLRLILLAGNLSLVTAVQHLIGLAMAVAIYAVLLRRGVPRWLAALAAAPVLLDGYQLQMEQTIMPDVWFQALILAGLVLLLWRRPIPLWMVASAGLAMGVAVTFREVGEILIVPGVVYLAASTPSLRRVLVCVGTLCVAFVLPVLAYLTIADAVTGHFRLSQTGTSGLYGRVAAAADCATLRVPASERAMCPSARQRAVLGVDGLEHSQASPVRRYYSQLPHAAASAAVSSFTRAVLAQQPARVLSAIAGDAAKLFALTRNTRPGDTPIARWQFQARYPFYYQHATRPEVMAAIADSGGGGPAVTAPVAAFLRSYQLDGGYTPGPLFAVAALAGLIGSLGAAGHPRPARARGGGAKDTRRPPAGHAPALACLLFFLSGAAVLLTGDVFEFSWRYQLPALITLPPAGALGLVVIGSRIGYRRGAAGTCAALLLAPMLLVQARRTMRRTPRLPGPGGPRQGAVGHGDPARRLLVIGESTAAGVGADRHARALPGFLAAELRERLGGTVDWTVCGQSGATARRVLADVVPVVPARHFDVIVLTVGINDLISRRRLGAWETDMIDLIDALGADDHQTQVVVSGMPPVHRVPAIPQPLRFLLGGRARAMDRVTRRVAAAHGATYVPVNEDIGSGRGVFAPDGFHPSEAGYRIWARALAREIDG